MATETLSFSTPGTFPSTAYGEYNKNGYGNNNACYYYSSGWYRLIFLRQFTLTKAMKSVDLTLAAGAVSGQRYGAGYNRLNHFRCAIYPASTAFDPWPASSASSDNGKKIDTWTYGGTASTSGSLTFTTDSAGNAFTAQTYYVYIWYYREQTTNYASSGNITVSGTGTPSVPSVPSIYVKTAAGTWSPAVGLYVKTAASTWTEADNMYVKTGSSTWDEST